MRFRVVFLNVTFLLANLVLLGACAPLAQKPAAIIGPIEDVGNIADAPYRIEIPADWNGRLVMLQHGYEPVGVPRQQPWPQNEAAPIFLSMGYAVAASGYSAQGWAVAEAINDVDSVYRHFLSTYGTPKATYLVGVSLGGHISLATLEQRGDAYAGALSYCGVNLPAAMVFDDGIVTPLVALDHYFPQALALADGGLVDPDSPPTADPEAIEAALSSDEANAAKLVTRLEIPRSMLAGAMMLNYMVLREMQRRAGGHPVDNRNTVYVGFGDDEAFNRGVRRYAGVPKAVEYLSQNADLTGRVKAPVVLLNNRVDPTIPARFATVYPELVTAAGRSEHLAVLPQIGETHCDFTPEQISAAFGGLVAWAEGGNKPDSH